MENIDNFKKELKELLIKYNASIGFNCGENSDTHGLYDEKMVIDIEKKEIEICQGWCFGQEDL